MARALETLIVHEASQTCFLASPADRIINEHDVMIRTVVAAAGAGSTFFLPVVLTDIGQVTARAQ